MKQSNYSLTDFAKEIQRQQDAKKDYLVHASKIQPYGMNGQLEVAWPLTGENFFQGTLTATGHQQIGALCNVPKPYYDLMNTADSVGLLAKNLEHWLNKLSDRRMLRTMDGKVRAVLSDRYRPLDNHQILEALLPILMEARADIVSCEITERKMFLKALVHHVQTEVKAGDVIEAGIIIQNSETGHSSLSIKPLIHRLICMNGAVINELSHRKFHVGKKMDEFSGVEHFSTETRIADDKAYFLKVRDLVKQSLSEATLKKAAGEMRKAAGIIVTDPAAAIVLATERFQLNQEESSDMLKHLISGGDLSNYGVMNSITAMAQNVPDYERSCDLESIGYRALSQNWNLN